MMKQVTLMLGLVITVMSCGSGQSNKLDLNVPDEVEIKKGGSHQQFPGTRLFIVKPEGYLALPSLIRFQKNTKTYIQAFEGPGTSFTSQKASAIKSIELREANGLKVYYKKEFKLGDFDAYLVYGADTKPNLDQMVLSFGDNEFTALIAAELPSHDEEAMQECLTSLLTIYHDKSVKPDYSALARFTLDLSESEFKYHSNASQMFFYTINGQGDPENNVFENLIIISSLPSLGTFEERKAYAEKMAQGYKKHGITFSGIEEKEIDINGVNAYEIIMNGSFKGKSVKVYQVILGDNKATLIFCGMAYDRQDELLKQFKGISQTLRIK